MNLQPWCKPLAGIVQILTECFGAHASVSPPKQTSSCQAEIGRQRFFGHPIKCAAHALADAMCPDSTHTTVTAFRVCILCIVVPVIIM